MGISDHMLITVDLYLMSTTYLIHISKYILGIQHFIYPSIKMQHYDEVTLKKYIFSEFSERQQWRFWNQAITERSNDTDQCQTVSRFGRKVRAPHSTVGFRRE